MKYLEITGIIQCTVWKVALLLSLQNQGYSEKKNLLGLKWRPFHENWKFSLNAQVFFWHIISQGCFIGFLFLQTLLRPLLSWGLPSPVFFPSLFAPAHPFQFSLIVLYAVFMKDDVQISTFSQTKKKASKEFCWCLGDFQVHLLPSACSAMMGQRTEAAVKGVSARWLIPFELLQLALKRKY